MTRISLIYSGIHSLTSPLLLPYPLRNGRCNATGTGYCLGRVRCSDGITGALTACHPDISEYEGTDCFQVRLHSLLMFPGSRSLAMMMIGIGKGRTLVHPKKIRPAPPLPIKSPPPPPPPPPPLVEDPNPVPHPSRKTQSSFTSLHS